MKQVTIEIDIQEIERVFIHRCSTTWTNRTDKLVTTIIEIINDYHNQDRTLHYNEADIDQIIYILWLLKQQNGSKQLAQLFRKAKIPIG